MLTLPIAGLPRAISAMVVVIRSSSIVCPMVLSQKLNKTCNPDVHCSSPKAASLEELLWNLAWPGVTLENAASEAKWNSNYKWCVGIGSWTYISWFSKYRITGRRWCWDDTERDGIWIPGCIHCQDGSVHQSATFIMLSARLAPCAIWACPIRVDETAWRWS